MGQAGAVCGITHNRSQAAVNGHNVPIVYDAGGAGQSPSPASDEGERVVLPYLLLAGIRKLDAVILTHPHRDHVGGMPAVLRETQVGLLLDPQIPCDEPRYAEMLTVAAQRSIPTRPARAGQRLSLGREAVLEVLWPAGAPVRGTADDVNNNSVVARVSYGNFRALLTGDVQEETERMLVGSGTPLQSTLLKLPHHGSKTSSSSAFLDAVRPEVAVATCGGGTEGGVDDTIRARLAAVGCALYRTDRDGAVTVVSDGTGYRVHCFAH